MPLTPDYKLVIADLDGTPIVEVPHKNLQFTHALNRPGTINFQLHPRHEKSVYSDIAPGERELHVYRDGTKIWGGYLWFAGANREELRFSGEGWFSRLNHRYIDTDQLFSGTDQLDIAWDLIDFTQGQTDGDLGITRFDPAEASGVTRDRNYFAYERKNIGEAIIQLSEVENGFDFEITPDKEWKTYYPNKGAAIPYVFELGKNIRNFGIEYDAQNIANEITALGSGEAEAQLRSVATDTAKRAQFGLLEDTRSFLDVSVQATLDDHATEELRLAKDIQTRVQLALVTDDPPFGAYTPGDQARVDIDYGYVQFNETLRITTIVTQISDAGFESVTVFFEGEAV